MQRKALAYVAVVFLDRNEQLALCLLDSVILKCGSVAQRVGLPPPETGKTPLPQTPELRT